MTQEAKKRKETPVKSGVLDYFPDAIKEVAHCSWVGNEQHNPGTALHWDRSKSGDELDALSRHLLDAGTMDTDGVRHSAKVAWRALANLQKEIEREAQDEWEEEIIRRSEEDDYTSKPNLSDYPEGNGGDISWGPYTAEHEAELENRMKIIGQNGNEGLHYDSTGAVEYTSYPGDVKITIDGAEKS